MISNKCPKKLLFVFVFAASLNSFAQGQSLLHKGDWIPKEGDFSKLNATQLDPRVRAFSYSPDVVFNLPVTVGLHTHIVVGDDEEITETPILGETIQWRVTGNAKNLYIKALKAGVATSFTFVTDKRIYQIELRSTNNPDLRVQKVYFEYPETSQSSVNVTLNNEKNKIKSALLDGENKKYQAELDSDKSFKESVGYKVSGNGSLINTEIYDDGTRTFIRMPQGLQDLPAVFILDDGKLAPVNYNVENRSSRGNRDVLVIERRAKEWVLKLGKYDVRIVKQ